MRVAVFITGCVVAGAVATVAIVAMRPAGAPAPDARPTAGTAATDVPEPAPIDFGDEIRPILAAHCLACHGFDPSTREAGLRLDTFDGATRTPDHGGPAAIVPGDPDGSALLERVLSSDPHHRMPLDGEPLPAPQIDTLRRWIAQGAPYERHWSLEPIVEPTPPEVDDPAWAAHPIDRFIRARQQHAGLPVPAEADRRTLLRRASFALTGLPPTPEDVAAFEQDTAPGAFERVVDRLLESPRFGERWARHWLDLMRYAETYAHEFDYPIRHAWQYRDYVIRACNADIPFDDFVVEHIAGDLVDSPRRHPELGYDESIIGTGFWWLSQGTHAPVDVRLDEAERIDNQIDVLSKAFLGTTVSCARCHDHKFDPIYTSEYYGIAGLLQSTRRQEAYLDPGGAIADTIDHLRSMQREAAQAWTATAPDDLEPADATVATLLLGVAAVLGPDPAPPAGDSEAWPIVRPIDSVAAELDLDAATLERWVTAFRARPPQTSPVADTAHHPADVWLTHARAAGGASAARAASIPAPSPTGGTVSFGFGPADDTAWFRSGWAFDAPVVRAGTVRMRAGLPSVAERSSLDSGTLGDAPMGTVRSPTFEITEPTLGALVRGRGVVRVVVDGYTMDEYNALLFAGMRQDVDAADWTWRTHDVRRFMGHRAHYEVIDDRSDASIELAEVRWSPSGPPTPPAAWSADRDAALTDVATAAAAAIASARAGTSDGGGSAAFVNWLTSHGLLGGPDLRAPLAAAAATMPTPMRVMAAEDGTGEDERVFIRGMHTTLGDVAPRQFLSALIDDPSLDIDRGSGRLAFAEKLLDPANPMPARVMVNRVWQHLLSRGLVATPDDFGLLGGTPTHPELLDWLAARFRGDMEWSVKTLIRTIVTSRTFRIAGGPLGPEAITVDPTNDLLSVRPPHRLSGESVRDAILAVSGQLDPTMYGESVPVHLTDFMTGRGRPRDSGPLDGDGRRSIYMEVRRNFLPPMMQAFDTPVPHATMGKRAESNVPAQSLILLNDPFVLEQAARLADRIGASDDSNDVDGQLEQLYRLALARGPKDAERDAARQFLTEQTALHLAAPDAAEDAAPGEEADDSPPTRDANHHEQATHAAWVDLCHVILNLKEFRYIE